MIWIQLTGMYITHILKLLSRFKSTELGSYGTKAAKVSCCRDFQFVTRMLDSFKTKNKAVIQERIAEVLADLTSRMQLDIETLDTSFKNKKYEKSYNCRFSV